jgi:polyisoprenyl-phosphate glycosyltransferase
MEDPDLSVVLPMYNEADVVDAALERVRAVLEASGRPFELVCIDDGSTDGTGERLARAAVADPRVVPISFSRNFGKEAALLAGLEVARGRAVLFLDADLQHPPELIPAMLERWDQGFDVVDAVKVRRGRESALRRAAAGAFYRLLSRAAGVDLADSADFKLLDRQVVDALLRCPERARFFRGLVAWVGFRVTRVEFEVQERTGGRSKWGSRSLLGYSLRNLVAFSPVPLRLVALIGFATVAAGAIVAADTLYNWARGGALTGFTTVILLIYWLSGLILLSLGVLGYYVSQMYEEQKARPVFVIRSPREPKPGEEAGAPPAD